MTDTAFTCITASESGYVYAGTNGKGMVRYDNTSWRLWNGMFNPINKGYIRQIAVSNDSVWIANSGYVFYLGFPEAGNNMNLLGGIHLMGKRNNIGKLYYKGRPVLGQMPNAGPPTRNILGVAIDASGKPWCAASYHDSTTYPAFLNYNARYHYAPGAVGKFNYAINNFDFVTGPALPDPTGILLGVGNNYQDENYSIGKRRTIRVVAKVGNEMWAASDGYDQAAGNTITAGILRYDMAGNYLGKFDQNNTGIPFGLTNSSMAPWAMYQDAVGRVWVGMNSTRGLAVLDTNGVWTHIGLPAVLNNGQVRAHAIAGNNRGEVFFGTNSGLLMYKGSGSFLSDTSYVLYTTAQGLSSNIIQGVAVAKDETIWLATAAGVNKILKGNLFIYNLSKNVYVDGNESANGNVRRVIAAYDSKLPQTEINKDTLFIAADSTKATVFKWIGASTMGIKFRIIDGDHPLYDEQQHGKFITRYRDEDSLRIQYQHPSYIYELYSSHQQYSGKNVRLEVVDTVSSPETVLLNIPVKFVLPPVLMLHGIWSDGENAWGVLKNFLANNNKYNYKSYELLAPSYPPDEHFASNRKYIPEFIKELKQNCAQNRTSVGKVDIVAHSMGGILTRLYLQSGTGGPKYLEDIHKLITVNTPHSGSPWANIVVRKDWFFKWFMKAQFDKNPFNGALEDLSTGKPVIDSLLNGPDLNKNIVPSHVIYTVDTIPEIAEYVNGKINDFIKPSIKIKPRPYLNIVSPSGVRINPYLLAAKGLLGGLKYYLQRKVPCPFDTHLQTCLRNVFGSENDFVVSDSSQRGGMYDAETFIPSLNHLNVCSADATMFRIQELFRAKAMGNDFSRSGFHPRSFPFDPNVGTLPSSGRNGTDSVRIISPSYGASFNRGDSVRITVRATSSINRMIIGIGYENDFDIFGKEDNDSVFRYKIPDDVLSRVYYKIIAHDLSGNEYTDSSYFTINADPTLVVDSIKVMHPQKDDLKIVIYDSTSISIMGYFNDGFVRDITEEAQLSFTRLTNSVSNPLSGNIKGLILGFDELKATYLGKSDSVQIEVVPRIPYDTVPTVVLPVRFTSINARYNGKEVDVTWRTAMEQNNRHFEIEHSTDGRNFSPVGRVTATNYPNGSNYAFNHTGFVNGNNYYRIKQVDFDGQFSRSEIAIANVKLSGSIAIYPNPADALLIVDFSRNLSHNAKQVRIANTLGQVLIEQNIVPASAKTSVVIDGLPSGIYTIEVIDSNGKRILTERIIKNK